MTSLQRKVVYGTYLGSKRVASVFNAVANGMHAAQREHYFWDEYRLPFRKRVEAWRNGFTSRGYLLLELDVNDPNDYLSYAQQAKRVYPAINPEYMDVIENKVAFHLSTTPYTDYVPELFGYVKRGDFVPRSDSVPSDVVSLVEREGDVIVKPIRAAGGKRVKHVRYENGTFFVNDSRVTQSAVTEVIQSVDDCLVVEYVAQHEYAEQIWPESTNSIRVLTMVDPDTGEFFVGRATHRFGSSKTGPTDNWSGGGFAAPVDVNTGTLQELVSHTPDTGKRCFDNHPETGTEVLGTQIPHWDQIQSAVLEVARVHEQNPYVGWDIVLDADGQPQVIEGNCAPGLTTLQLGGGLFEDDRIKRFFEEGMA